MTERATVGDMVRVVKLTYNGRECAPVTIEFGAVEEGSLPRVKVTALLPKGWDQGPVNAPPGNDGHRFFVEQCVIEPENDDALLQVVIGDLWSGKKWKLTR